MIAPPRRSARAARALAGALPLLVGAVGASAGAQVVRSEEHAFRVDTVVTGLARPWGMAFLPDGEILVTERGGRLRLVRGGRLVTEPVDGVPPVRTRGQGGLLDVALHPRFAENRLVYFTYSKPGIRGATTALARGRLEGMRLRDVDDVFVARAWWWGGAHFGSRIVFDRAGHVFVSVGERNRKSPAQELDNHMGKIVRLHDDGRVPRDNPFAGREGARPEIWSYGHRNPQGLALHPQTGALWEHEHGARGGDELNLIEKGKNYGWPAITHGVDYSGERISPDTARAGLEQPVLHWTPSIAPSGLAFYTGDRFPRWRGNAFVGTLETQHLRRVVLDGGRVVHQEPMLRGIGRVRTVTTGPDGLLYLLIDAPDGALVRLVPVDGEDGGED